MHDIAPILTAFALCLAAVPGVIAAVVSFLTRRDVAAQAAKIAEVQKTAESVHDAVNSKMDRLLAVVKTSSHAEGVIEGKAIEKATGQN